MADCATSGDVLYEVVHYLVELDLDLCTSANPHIQSFDLRLTYHDRVPVYQAGGNVDR